MATRNHEYHRRRIPRKNERIAVIRMPDKITEDVAWSMVVDDRLLIDTICKYSKELRDNGIKIYERRSNVISTEAGYFFAIREEDMAMVDAGEFKPNENESGNNTNQ